jgi:hypothetical protein
MSRPTETIPTMMFSVIAISPGDLEFSAGEDVNDAEREERDSHADVNKIHHE